jgi:hypothetical protein
MLRSLGVVEIVFVRFRAASQRQKRPPRTEVVAGAETQKNDKENAKGLKLQPTQKIRTKKIRTQKIFEYF